ncbi:unnamed protein product [Brachionus calyciflorus]|uniref:Vitelline membrane outer layer 1-like protein n=1 Tax=Brachionus calyciflorus TaxID=104777 RepID=A0A814EED5_9BILA|nr:unnamed protein product [Brachionus calyciflorus]
MFLIRLKSVCRWLVMTEFEIFLNFIAILIFTILLVIKLDMNNESLTWFKVFLPLFIVDLLQANFCSILFIRQLMANQKKHGILRLVVSSLLLLSRFMFKLSTFQIVNSSNGEAFKFQLAIIPVYFHLVILMFKTCGLKKHQILQSFKCKNDSNKRIIYTKRSNSIISSVNNLYGVNWGIWGSIEECDQNDYVVGFRTKRQPNLGTGLGVGKDDTELNGVELICSNGKRLKSSEGQWGSWDTDFRNCSSGQKVNGFSYGIEKKQEIYDDSATNVIRLKCTDNSTIQSLEGPWSTSIIPLECLYGTIVGIRTQIDENIYAEDNTGLNNIEFVCKLN